MSSQIKAALNEATEKDWKDFFKEYFEEPINRNLRIETSVPAETHRQQAIQTEKILNYLLTFRKK